MRSASLILCALLTSGAASALELEMPHRSQLVSDRGSPFSSYALPIGAWQDGGVQTETVEGRVDRQSWRVNSGSITTLQIVDPLRTQLDEAGFETVLSCDAASCGGFDFRFAIEVIPAPDMYVDIRDYRFLSARNQDIAVSLLVSRSRTAGYIQVIQVAPVERPALQVELRPDDQSDDAVDALVEAAPVLADRLVSDGHVVLADLQFETGTTQLRSTDYASLRDLAAFMRDNPDASIALVGHTDATGSLGVNISVSQQRAASVANLLVEQYGISAERLQAEGMGYLSPIASHLTPEGREANRRVEAVLLRLE